MDEKRRELEAARVASSASGAAAYGARGIINSSHFYDKQTEFRAWLSEVRGISADVPVPKAELMAAFASYVEDYNTATLPHEKFYDMDKYEASVRSRGGDGAPRSSGGGGVLDILAESQARKAAAAAAARAADMAKVAAVRASMTSERLAELQSQARMAEAMRYAFKAGDVKEAARLQRVLDEKAQPVFET